jgi:hypothetical protein
MPKKALFEAATQYLKRHPEELVRAARNAAGFRFGVPLDAFRWLAGQATGKKAPRDIEIASEPPGLRVAATINAMGTEVRASGIVFIDRVEFSSEAFLIGLRLQQLALKVLDETSDTPIAALIRSGALDLSRPGNLASFMPKRPAMLVEAKDDHVVLDLMKHPKLAKNPNIGRILGIIAPLIAVRAVESEPEHFDVVLAPFPDGFAEAINSAKEAL